MWSHEVSQLTGQYTQQALQQNMYANSIGMMNPGMYADVATGNMANYAQAVGSPMMGAGAALLGLDPFSMGLKGAGLGMSMGMGFGGMAGMAAAFAAPAIVGGAAMNWAGGQMWTGAQQQQQLNMGLRQNFGFMRPNGQGFNNGEMGMIGSQIRHMTHEVGAGGEMHSFRELSALAGNMGRMGFSQNITDVRQFTAKFKEMVSTLKTVATELNTSLESAQQMVVGMRSSGIFAKSDQLNMSRMMRQNAVNGIDLETSSAMGNIGSQIARSIGGRGVSGAIAGVRTIGDIGTAMKTGALTEEDIYNATGLTGMAGQQAMATSQLESSARFLRSGRGRFVLAGLADEQGNLNQNALNEFMSGNMSVGRTGAMAGNGLGRVGAASFLRNEGRLRSSVLEAVGGNVNTLALMQWAQHSGIDIGAMGDREMIFAGRQLHMGRDELESAVKMANALPDIMKEQRRMSDMDMSNRKDMALKQNSGLNGVKNSYNHFKEKLSGGVQSIGQSMYNEATNYVERYINEMSNTIVSDLTAQAEKDLHAYVRGGANSASGARGGAIAKLSRGAGIHGSAQITNSSFDIYQNRIAENTMLGGLKGLLGGESIEHQLGLNFKASSASSLSKQDQFDFFRNGLSAYDKGLKGSTDSTLAGMLPGTSSDELKGKTGDDYMRTLNRLVQTHGTEKMRNEWNRAYGDANIDEVAGMRGGANMRSDEWAESRRARLDGRERLGHLAAGAGIPSVNTYKSVDMESLLTQGFAGTDADRLDSIGRLTMAGTLKSNKGRHDAAMSTTGRKVASVLGGMVAGGAAGLATLGLGALPAGAAGYAAGGAAYDKLRDRFGAKTVLADLNYGYDHEVGEIAKANALFVKDNMREGAAAFMGGDDEVLKSVESRIGRLQNKEHRNTVEESEYRSLNTLMAASEVRKAGGMGKVSNEKWQELQKRYGGTMSIDELKMNIEGTATAFHKVASSQDLEESKKYRDMASKRLSTMYDSKTGKLIVGESAGEDWEKAHPEAAKLLHDQRNMQEKMSHAEGMQSAHDIYNDYSKRRDSSLYAMSEEDRAKRRSELAMSGVSGSQDEIEAIDDISRTDRRFKSTARYGKFQAAKLADGNLSMSAMRKMQSARSPEEMLAVLTSEGGLSGLDDDGRSAFKTASKQLQSKDLSERDAGVKTLMGLKDNNGVKKEDFKRRKAQAERDPAQKAMIDMAADMRSLLSAFQDDKGKVQKVMVQGTVNVSEQESGGLGGSSKPGGP